MRGKSIPGSLIPFRNGRLFGNPVFEAVRLVALKVGTSVVAKAELLPILAERRPVFSQNLQTRPQVG